MSTPDVEKIISDAVKALPDCFEGYDPRFQNFHSEGVDDIVRKAVRKTFELAGTRFLAGLRTNNAEAEGANGASDSDPKPAQPAPQHAAEESHSMEELYDERNATPLPSGWTRRPVQKINQHRFVVHIYGEDGNDAAIAIGRTAELSQQRAAAILVSASMATNEASSGEITDTMRLEDVKAEPKCCGCKQVMTEESPGFWICWPCDQRDGALINKLYEAIGGALADSGFIRSRPTWRPVGYEAMIALHDAAMTTAPVATESTQAEG